MDLTAVRVMGHQPRPGARARVVDAGWSARHRVDRLRAVRRFEGPPESSASLAGEVLQGVAHRHRRIAGHAEVPERNLQHAAASEREPRPRTHGVVQPGRDEPGHRCGQLHRDRRQRNRPRTDRLPDELVHRRSQLRPRVLGQRRQDVPRRATRRGEVAGGHRRDRRSRQLPVLRASAHVPRVGRRQSVLGHAARTRRGMGRRRRRERSRGAHRAAS